MRDGGREMPINESASAKTRLGCAKEQSYDQNDKRGRTRRENPIARRCDSLAIKRGGNARLPLADGPTLGVSSSVCHRRNRPFLRVAFRPTSLQLLSAVVSRFASRKRTRSPLATCVKHWAVPRKIGSPVPIWM